MGFRGAGLDGWGLEGDAFGGAEFRWDEVCFSVASRPQKP